MDRDHLIAFILGFIAMVLSIAAAVLITYFAMVEGGATP